MTLYVPRDILPIIFVTIGMLTYAVSIYGAFLIGKRHAEAAAVMTAVENIIIDVGLLKSQADSVTAMMTRTDLYCQVTGECQEDSTNAN